MPSPNTDFVAVAAGYVHSLGLKSDGSIVAWGENWNGQTNVPLPNADFAAVAAGWGHALGVKSDGRIVAWGWNGFGQTTVPSPNASFGQQSGIVPPRGPTGGGTTVTILGYNLGNGTPFSVRDVIQSVERVAGRAVPWTGAPRRAGDPGVLFASSARIRAELGWVPRFAELDGIVDTAWRWRLAHPYGFAREAGA